MTWEQRTAIRLAVDATVRARIDWSEPRCAGCGVELADDDGHPLYAQGCRPCAARRSKRRQRERVRPLQLALAV